MKYFYSTKFQHGVLANKQAILLVTSRVSKDVIKAYHKLCNATAAFGDVFLLYHAKDSKIPAEVEGIKMEVFDDEILNSLGYIPIRKTLVPGSNHFPVLQFFLKHPEYTFYWCLEDDVAFSGNWNNFFKNISSNNEYDFITSHIRKYADLPSWPWWRTLNVPGGKFSRNEMLRSFNPVYRISNKALQYIDACLKGKYSGHHEVLLPTLLKTSGFKIADFGTEDNHVTPALSFCTLNTMRWKPVFLFSPNKKNLLYHPAKSKVTFKQVLVFFKRTIYNQTEYS